MVIVHNGSTLTVSRIPRVIIRVGLEKLEERTLIDFYGNVRAIYYHPNKKEICVVYSDHTENSFLPIIKYYCVNKNLKEEEVPDFVRTIPNLIPEYKIKTQKIVVYDLEKLLIFSGLTAWEIRNFSRQHFMRYLNQKKRIMTKKIKIKLFRLT